MERYQVIAQDEHYVWFDCEYADILEAEAAAGKCHDAYPGSEVWVIDSRERRFLYRD